MILGYHASQEQFSPRELLDLIPHVEGAGFKAVMTSDHITPWSVRQGQSGFNWSWLGSAMERSSMPFGTLAIPGSWRYHPVVLAQAVCTLCQMYPHRMPWIAAGSGEYMNEHVAGEDWPEKHIRNERLAEGVEILRLLFGGGAVSFNGKHLSADRAKIWSLPATPPKIFAAALTGETARWAGAWADGLITVRKPPEDMKRIIEAFRTGGGKGKPIILQMQISWAETKGAAVHNVWDQWRSTVLSPADFSGFATAEEFDHACQNATPEEVAQKMPVSDNAEDFVRWIKEYADMGISEIYLHNAGRNQREFIEYFGAHVLKRAML